MEIIDISVPVSPKTLAWPGAPKTEFSWRRQMALGDVSNNSNIFMNCHAGTHVDAPLHYVKKGDSIEKIPLTALVGEAWVLEIADAAEISAEELEKIWPVQKPDQKVERVLFKTSNSLLGRNRSPEFDGHYCALNESGARWLAEKKLKLIGNDYFSIQKYKQPPVIHQCLLQADIVLLEGIDLSKVAPGKYELICLPLKLEGLEAAPARAVLRR